MDYKPPLTISEIQVSYKPKKAHRPQVLSSSDAVKVLLHCYDQSTIGYVESFITLYLNRANRVLGYKVISQGGISGTVVDARVVMAVALQCGACSIVLSHNHPSYHLQPSQADLDLTKKLKGACEFFDILLLDHVILDPDGGFLSFADEGYL